MNPLESGHKNRFILKRVILLDGNETEEIVDSFPSKHDCIDYCNRNKLPPDYDNWRIFDTINGMQYDFPCRSYGNNPLNKYA